MTIDHLVYAAPDLELAVADLEGHLGVRAAYGGRHPGRGTWNALIALSDSSYLEIVAPDPAQSEISGPRWFGLDTLDTPRLVAWAEKCRNIEQCIACAAQQDVVLGSVADGTRQRDDGIVLRWRCTDPGTVVEEGLIPFLIDWTDTPHPALTAPRGPVLLSLRAEHPDPSRVVCALSALGLALPVARSPHPGLMATLRTARGEVELR